MARDIDTIKLIVDGQPQEVKLYLDNFYAIDAALNPDSVNPVQNKAIVAALNQKVDKVPGMGLSQNSFTDTEKEKLGALPTSAELTVKLSEKVDKEAGKGLSTNDYTTAEKDKLQGIETGAQVNTVFGVKGGDESVYRTGNVNITKTNIGLGKVDNTADLDKPISTAVQNALDLKANAALIGAANGIAELDLNGFVPAAQLPSYVDDILEFASVSAFPATGETGKIYVALDTNLTYRWGGSEYVEISQSLALGETSGTAYRGDRGKAAYDHSQKTSGNPHNVSKSDVGLGNVDNTADLDKPISTAVQNALSTINSNLSQKANASDVATALANQKYFYIDSEGYGCINYDLF